MSFETWVCERPPRLRRRGTGTFSLLAQPPLLYEEGNTQTCNSFTPSSKAPKLLYGRLCGRDVTSPALMLLDLNGEVRSSAPRPDGVEPLSHTYRKVGAGWIAW